MTVQTLTPASTPPHTRHYALMYAIIFVACVFHIQAKPSLSFNLPGPFGALGTNREHNKQLKIYSGKRVKNDSIRMVYFYDQTVAVVELGPKKLLLNCEFLEIFEPEQVLGSLGEFEKIARPVGVSFREMLTLMDQCKELEDVLMTYRKHEEEVKNQTDTVRRTKVRNMPRERSLLANNPFTLLSGIIPGTKWCGTGDIAKDYFDLGLDTTVDKCCRAHDLCPVKVRSYSKRYNLTNNSLYTKSHCKCDDNLFYCLKNHASNTANIMGNIYFNLVQIPCVEDGKNGRKFRSARNNF